MRAELSAGLEIVGEAGTVDEAIGAILATDPEVVVVDGEADNRKITHPDDLAWVRSVLESSVGMPDGQQGSDGSEASDQSLRQPGGRQ